LLQRDLDSHLRMRGRSQRENDRYEKNAMHTQQDATTLKMVLLTHE
jgi:hypothetical protein